MYGGYASVTYNDQATQLINQSFADAAVCDPAAPAAGAFWPQFTPQAGNSCSPDVSWYQVGTRTQFNPAPLMDIGLDVFYTKINSAYKGPVNWVPNGSCRPAATPRQQRRLRLRRQGHRHGDRPLAAQLLSVIA